MTQLQTQAPGSFVTTSDGTQIFYKDWGTGQPLFFHHGWPLSADDWDAIRTVFPKTSSIAFETAPLVMHGEDDQICPFPITGARSVKLLKRSTLKSYPGLPHGMPTTHAELINADLLSFIQAG